MAMIGSSMHKISQAQLSTLPRRYRRAQSYSSRRRSSNNNVMAMGTSHAQLERHSESKITVKRKTRELASDEELSLSMPQLKSATFDLSMSIPSLEESEFGISSMSLLLEQAELSLSLSLPMFDDVPTEMPMDESETISTERSNASSTLILSSFIAGLSALVVGATAMFLKMQRLHARELEQSEVKDLYDV